MLTVTSENEPSVPFMQKSRLGKLVQQKPYYCEFHSHMINYWVRWIQKY